MATQAERWVAGAGPGFNVPGMSPEETRRARIASFAERAQRFPGVMGNGATGVNPGDEHGYMDMLAAQRQFGDDINAEQGKGPMDVRSAPMTERGADSGAAPAMRGLQMAMHGGSYAGGGDSNVDDNGASRTQRLANAVRQRDLEEELMNPASTHEKLGTNLSDEEMHSASANDFLQKSAARTAGQIYQMPEVAGPRNEDIANKLAQLQRQYVDPANIKADADVTSAQLGYEGQQARATGQTDSARLSGAAAIRAAQERAAGDRGAADSRMLGDLGSYGVDPKALQGLIQAMRQMGLLGGAGGGR